MTTTRSALLECCLKSSACLNIRFIALQCITFQFVALQFITLQFIALHCNIRFIARARPACKYKCIYSRSCRTKTKTNRSSACLHCLFVISASASSSSDGMSAPWIWVGIGKVLGQVGLGWVGKGQNILPTYHVVPLSPYVRAGSPVQDCSWDNGHL